MSPSDEPRRTTRTFLVAGVVLLLLAGTGGLTQALGTPALPMALAEAEDAEDRGRWQAPFDSEIPAVNMALTADGDVVYYDGAEANESHHEDGGGEEPHLHPNDHTFFTEDPEYSQSRVYDPQADGDKISTPDNDPEVDLFCSGTTVRPDGDVMTVGGTEWPTLMGDEPEDEGQPVVDTPEVKGTDEVHRLPVEDADETWEDGPNMEVRRWYPTVVQTPDGAAFAAGGIKNLSEAETQISYMERLDPGADEWELLEPQFEVADGVTLDGHHGRVGNVELAPVHLPMYPKLFVVPSGPHEGEFLYPANGDLWAPFGERPEEALWGTFQFIDPDDGTVTFAGASPFSARQLGNAVPLMLDPADGYDLQVLSLGGTLERTGAATNTAELVDVDGERVTSEPVEPMHHARWNPNSVLLPTGDVVTVGGASFDNVLIYGQDKAPVLQAELYDTSEGEWKPLASMELPRDYHSTALLLPSGEVLVGGHVPLPDPPRDIRENVPGQDQRTVEKFEVFEPPYLHNDEDTRPEIASVSGNPADPAQEEAVANIGFGETFEVRVNDIEEGVDSAVLVRPGAVTHTVDADQRGIRLDVTKVTDLGGGDKRLTLEAPPDGNVAPPGHYMLFANEDLGDEAYPSEAAFVGIGPDSLLG